MFYWNKQQKTKNSIKEGNSALYYKHHCTPNTAHIGNNKQIGKGEKGMKEQEEIGKIDGGPNMYSTQVLKEKEGKMKRHCLNRSS